MGLLSHISKSEPAENTETKESEKKVSVKKAGSGLLAKASKATVKTFSSFQEWAKSNGFDHCGLFTNIRGMMVITHSYGIDAQTIASSVSSKDFWKGTLKKEEQIINYSKDDQDFYNYLQFFSFEMKNNVSHITFVKINDNSNSSILMIYKLNSDRNISISQEAINSLTINNSDINYEFTFENSAELKKHEYQLLQIDLSETVNSAIKEIQLPEAGIKNAVMECIYNEIFDLLKTAFPEPNYVSFKNNSIVKIAFSYSENFDDILLQSHINLLLNELLCKPEKYLSLVNNGKTNDSEKVINFLN
ncbi:MAG: hypothetical protein KBT21_11805 [Treponema sp.]|nr:hypothetical protein [Candidatus Treponema merdequi]